MLSPGLMVSLSAYFVSDGVRGVRQTVPTLSEVPDPLKLSASVVTACPFESAAEMIHTSRHPAGRTVFAGIVVDPALAEVIVRLKSVLRATGRLNAVSAPDAR